MVSANSSSFNHDDRQHAHQSYCRDKGNGFCKRGNWSILNIAAMVIGFMLFWPVGVLVLFWILSGRNIKDLPNAIERKWSAFMNSSGMSKCGRAEQESDNRVFNEYQQTQYDRIKEIKEEIVNRARNFKNFRDDAKRRADEEEFNQFMGNRPDA